ncbi:unnamed protein product [Adineta ricciae]|uniref:Uncharacterized protein n=1 Tax=Adineta ricciae TaxID=249248 RepID=A0A815UN04_ADIRI|nr:unnamed protein product [Adineta ricciae]CAF1522088.1 unnamed protein product [Adineta ricciae]
MELDLQQALDFAERRNFKRSMKYYETKKEKRRFSREQISGNPEESAVISSFSLDLGSKSKSEVDEQTSCLLENEISENAMNCQENLINVSEVEKILSNDGEIIHHSFDGSELSSADLNVNTEDLLHFYTHISTTEFCSRLLTLLRNSNTCKSQANRFLSFIRTILPSPNNVPTKMEDLLQQLDIENNILKKCLLCTNCNEYTSRPKMFCSKCSSTDAKNFAFVYDMNIEEYIKQVYVRFRVEIDEYRNQLYLHQDVERTNDIGFNHMYQQLLKNNENNEFITFLLHLHGISLSKSSNLKMWLFSGSIIELRPQLRSHRYNNIIFSFWFGYKEPDVKIWLGNCTNLIRLLKTKS